LALAEFTLLRPQTLEAAARLAAEPDACVIAGGTGLLPNLRRGIGAPRTLVSLDALAELREIERRDGKLRIGALASVAALSQSESLKKHYGAVREAASSVAAPAHRSAATLGGNLCLDTRCLYYNQSEEWRRANGYCLKLGGDTCHVAPQGRKCRAAYSGDLAPALLALGAEIEIAGADGARRVIPLEDLYRDDGADYLALAPGEIIAAALLPPSAAPGSRSGYAKSRLRGAIDFPLAGVAMTLALDGGRVTQLRVALTGTNSRPLLLQGCETFSGKTITPETADSLSKLVQKQAGPMRTTLVAADYRRQAASALARRLLARLAGESDGL